MTFFRNEQGSVTVFMLIVLIGLFAVGGLATDTAFAYRDRAALQATVDAAAMEAVPYIDVNYAKGRAAALASVERNMPKDEWGNVTIDTDVIFGQWTASGEFLPQVENDDSYINAVAVKGVRAHSRNNPTYTPLLKLIGLDGFSTGAYGIAATKRSCVGIIAEDNVSVDKDAKIGGEVCIYGKEGVVIKKDSLIDANAAIGAADLDDITIRGSEIPAGVLFSSDGVSGRAKYVDSIIDALEAGAVPGYFVEHVTELPDVGTPGTVYVIDGNYTVRKETRIEDSIIAIRGNINWGKEGAIINTRACEPGSPPVGIFATGNITVSKDGVIQDADLVSARTVHIKKDAGAVSVIIEADKVAIDKDANISECAMIRFARGLDSLVR